MAKKVSKSIAGGHFPDWLGKRLRFGLENVSGVKI